MERLMELDDTWTCGSCGAANIGNVFTGTCWRCDSSWTDKPLRVETAEELGMCPDCRSMDGYHKIDCPMRPLPREETP